MTAIRPSTVATPLVAVFALIMIETTVDATSAGTSPRPAPTMIIARGSIAFAFPIVPCVANRIETTKLPPTLLQLEQRRD